LTNSMDTIIGLGEAGCNLADAFGKYKQYQIYKIDVGLKGLKKNGIYDMPWQSNPERYEEKCPNMKNFFKNCSGDVLFIVGGSGDISGATLRILSHLRHCKVSILYVRPDIKLLPAAKKRQEWMAFNVLQEYARSAVFERLWLVDNPTVEAIIGEVPVIGYHNKLNELIVSTFHMLNVYNHIDAVVATFPEPLEAHRISTLGLYDLEKDVKKLFFPLYKTRDLRYYYAINKERLENDGKLFANIKEQVKNSVTTETQTSYGVYSTTYDVDYAYVCCHTPRIQRQKINNEPPLDFLLDK